jgi:hypothetical protein
MKRFWYSIADDEIKAFKGEIGDIPPDFVEINSGLGADRLYYRIKNDKITDVISEAIHEAAAKRRAEEFISALNVNLF